MVVAAWVVAAWLQDLWDRFPHLGVTSPEKRCGKTTMLDLLHQIVPRPRYTTNISPAALYRVVEKEHPTLLMDEAQSISRRGSEASEVMREILNAGIGRNAKVVRCGGLRMDEIQEFSVYGPKVFAMIGEPDGVLSDRCLPVALRRKTKEDEVRRCRSCEVEVYGSEVRTDLEKWTLENAEKVKEAYDSVDPFGIENDRMADLLTPLQAVLAVAAPDRVKELEEYARGLDEREREADRMEPGLLLLAACREIFVAHLERIGTPSVMILTRALIAELVQRTEEPWATFTRGKEITPEALANLLKPYGIRSEMNAGKTARGYVSARFEDAWRRYLPPAPPLENPPSLSNPSNPSAPSGNGEGGAQ